MVTDTSFRRKLLILTATLVGTMGVLATLYAGWLSYVNAAEKMRADGIELAQLYQQALLDPLSNSDDYQVYEQIAAPFVANTTSTRIQPLQHIVLLDHAGKVLASSHPRLIPLESSYISEEPEFKGILPRVVAMSADGPPQLIESDDGKEFFVIAPLSDGGMEYGHILLNYHEGGLAVNFIAQIRQSIIVIALFTLAMLLFARRAALKLVQPIRRLAGDMQLFARRHGLEMDQNHSRSRDEVAQLGMIFGELELKLTALMGSLAERDEEQRAYLQTLNLLQDAVIELAPDGRLLRATDAWKNMTGVNNIHQRSISECVHTEDAAEILEQLSALILKQKQQIHFRFRLLRKGDTDTHNWVEGRFAAVMHNDEVTSIRGVVRDITSTYLQERQISHMALHDALTNLPNRVLLDDRMEAALMRAKRNNKRVALGFIDLDHFKQVNDNFGHKTGDRLLKEVTKRLGKVLRHTDTLSRWGGDEFVVLCPDLDELQDAQEITRKLSLLTRKNIKIDDTEFPFTFSAGFAVYPDDASDSEMLLAQADRAMFYAKAQGRNNIQFFNTISGKETGRQSFYIQSRLTSAIHNNEIQAWLQPLVSAQSGEVIGAEVLARWHEAEQGWIPPSVFIPMAESLGLIDKLGQSVWLQALHAFPLLPAGHRLSVNLSKRQLFSSTIVQQFCDDIERANIKPEQIMLEITEGIALSDVEFARDRIAELDAIGFGIAVDDFGTGYSSLSQLHEIPADELKLDISFVRRIHEKSGLGIATAIVSIAKSLHMECVAEGVEDGHTAEVLRKLGVEILQGYYFAKPMPIEDYVAWLSNRESKQT